MQARDVLIYLSIKYKANWDLILTAIRNKEKLDVSEVNNTVSSLKNQTVTLIDHNYPIAFKGMCKPPFVLYYKGDLSLIQYQENCVTIVGSRKADQYALSMTKKLAEGLAQEGVTIVSGLAKGVDSEANKAALAYGKAVAFLGNGLDYYYPAENSKLQKDIAEAGLLISEYPPMTPPDKKAFPSRNRLLARVSKLILATSAKERSGTAITLMQGLENGADIACLPYRAEEGSFCNELIKEGAFLVESKEDLLFLLGIKTKYQKKAKKFSDPINK